MIDLIKFLQQLIQCPSVTPNQAGSLDLIEGVLSAAGFVCHRLPFGGKEDPRAADNLYARWGTGGVNFCFAGHVDVVPPGDLSCWSLNPFGGEIHNGRLYGRGAVDMKGSIAAFISAAIKSIQGGHLNNISISLLLTSDEEGPGTFGTNKVVEWLSKRGEVIDFSLVGEPTNPQKLGEMAKIGRRGSLSGVIRVEGRQGHVAYPHLNLNPIPPLINYLSQIMSHSFDQEFNGELDKGMENFDASHLEVIAINVDNYAINLTPAMAEAKFNIRFNPCHTNESLVNILTKIRDELTLSYPPELKWSLNFQRGAEPFITHNATLQGSLIRAVEEVTGLTPKLDTCGGTSDARFIKDICPVIEFGLNSNQAHQTDEHVAICDLIQLEEIYRVTLLNIQKSNT